MVAGRKTNIHTHMYIQAYTHTLFRKQFQKTRHVPTAGCGQMPGLKRHGVQGRKYHQCLLYRLVRGLHRNANIGEIGTINYQKNPSQNCVFSEQINNKHIC